MQQQKNKNILSTLVQSRETASGIITAFLIVLQGPKNINGVNPFTVLPSEGEILAGGHKLVYIIFSPDVEEQAFNDTAEIMIKGEVCFLLCSPELSFL